MANHARETRDSRYQDYPVLANAVIGTGEMVMITAAGYATVADEATSQKGAGYALTGVNATGLSSGALRVSVDTSEALWTNSADADLITFADVGAACYMVDGDKLAKTNGSSTRSAYGTITGVHANGKVWALPTLKK